MKTLQHTNTLRTPTPARTTLYAPLTASRDQRHPTALSKKALPI